MILVCVASVVIHHQVVVWRGGSRRGCFLEMKQNMCVNGVGVYIHLKEIHLLSNKTHHRKDNVCIYLDGI